MSRRAPIRELLLGAGLAVAVVACVAGPRKPQEPASPAWVTDIATRMQDIRNWRSDMGLRIEPADRLVRQMKNYRFAPMCPDNEPENQVCENTCRIAQDICDNAKEVCRISDDIQPNAWAAEQCNTAKASCKEATDKCCGCNAQNGDDADDAAATGTW